MVKRYFIIVFIHCFIIILCAKLFSFSKMQYELTKDQYNYSEGSQIILPNDLEYTDYLKAYPYYESDEIDIVVNEQESPYKVKVVPYYPEQYTYQRDIVYLSSKLKNIPDLHSIQLLGETYVNIEYVENTFNSIIYIPYENIPTSLYTCYFVDLESFDFTTFPHLTSLEVSKASQIRQNIQQLQESKQTTFFFQGVIIMIGFVISLILTYQTILMSKPLHVMLRVFGVSISQLMLVQISMFSICFILMMILLDVLRWELIYLLVGQNIIYLIFNYLFINKHSIALLLRKNKQLGG